METTRPDARERRQRLLELGADVFARRRYDDLSMAGIAREAGVSKALLYHYFPSKQAFFGAAMAAKAAELVAVTDPDPALAPVERLAASLDAYLRWIEAHAGAYGTLRHSVALVPEARDAVEQARRAAAERAVAALAPGAPGSPELRAAVRGWLSFMDGAIEDWLEHRDIGRDRLRGLLLGTLLGAVTAAAQPLTG
jgi:AcrR family transcriptional regulator